MFKAACFALFICSCLAFLDAAKAQENEDDPFARQEIAQEINALYEMLDQETITRDTVRSVAGVSCTTLRIVRRENLRSRAEVTFREETDLESQDFAAVIESDERFEEYLEFERERLLEAGVRQDVVERIIEQMAEERYSVPAGFTQEIDEEKIKFVEARTCELHSEEVDDPEEAANETELNFIDGTVDLVIGTGVVAVDAFAARLPGSAPFVAISMTDGSRRMSEGVDTLWESIKGIFD